MCIQEADFILLSESSLFHFPNGFPHIAQNIPLISRVGPWNSLFLDLINQQQTDVVMIETLPTLLVVNSLP